MAFFFKATATTETYTLSLHDALPICGRELRGPALLGELRRVRLLHPAACRTDRKSTRLNSSHSQISYAVFCSKKKIMVMTEVHGFVAAEVHFNIASISRALDEDTTSD